MRWLMAAFFAVAGYLHLTDPAPFLAITPDWVPFASWMVAVTGLCEWAGALGLLIRPLRWHAGIALALYALAVWPANFKHAFAGVDIVGLPSSWWYHAPRLALQPAIMWWALFSAGVIDWPLREGEH